MFLRTLESGFPLLGLRPVQSVWSGHSVRWCLLPWRWLAQVPPGGCEAGLFPGTVTNTGSALLLHPQKPTREERARLLVSPFSVAPHQVL